MDAFPDLSLLWVHLRAHLFLLTNVSYKFLSCSRATREKLLTFFQQNNVFEYTSATTVNEFVINELVKLTMH